MNATSLLEHMMVNIQGTTENTVSIMEGSKRPSAYIIIRECINSYSHVYQ